ncbi:MAG TPA: ATP-binding protein [Acidimicrobiales bacterium]|nr:ATP-binding protein [Acidimicrobiales bacterium]
MSYVRRRLPFAFVNRESELAALEAWWSHRGGRAGLVWGRRRVGKTALLQRFAEGRRTVFHTGAGRAAVGELVQLSRQVGATVPSGLRDLTARPYADWDDALDSLAELGRQEPLLVVLDEFPELVGSSPDLPGVLRAFLDRAAGRTKLRLLLCGSAVRTMQGLQEEREPLYGRFDLSLQLNPFGPAEAARMLTGLAPSDRALVYGLVGGMPLYLSWWDEQRSVRENLRHLVCQPGAPLLTEGQLVLATEVEAGEHPAAALHAIAAGRTRYGQIKDYLRAEPARTLDRLIELRLVERLVPVTEGEASRRRLYRLTDNFLAFYLGVLGRYRAEIERGLGESILDVLVESLDDHMGPRYEQCFRDHLRAEAAAGRLGTRVVAVGPWWRDDPPTQIDAVVLAGRERKPTLVGESKWARRTDASRLVAELRAKAAGLGELPDLRYAVCARERLTNVPSGVLAFTAQDIFGA